MTAAAGYANVEMQAKYDARNPAALRKLLNAGTELRPFTEQTMDACLKASNEVNAEAAASNADFKKIYEAMMAFRNEEYIWWQVGEFSFDNFMIRSRRRG
jgi:TRAP-type mannitol/chloroaromatic compound transport system substrate-binding protein